MVLQLYVFNDGRREALDFVGLVFLRRLEAHAWTLTQ